jgi:PPOX class probable F420-dependent enzyme
MARMTEVQWRTFLAERPRTAKVATVRLDGRPHVAPVWIDLDSDGTVLFTTHQDSLKGKALQRDPRVSVCVDDESPPFAFVIIDGTASLAEDPAALLHWATRIGGRYMGANRADAYGRRNGVPGELLVRVTPVRVVAARNVSD